MKNFLLQLCLSYLVLTLCMFCMFVIGAEDAGFFMVFFALFALVAGIASRIEKYKYHTFFITHPKPVPTYRPQRRP